MAEKIIVSLCPKCSNVLEVKDGMFRTVCPTCREKIRYDDVAQNPVTCRSCGKLLDKAVVKDNICPVCAKPVDPEMERRVIDCPLCSLPVYYQRGATAVTCVNPSCGHVFNPTAREELLESIHTNDAPDIRMTQNIPADQLVWQYRLDSKSHSIATNARVHAASGFYAVVRQGNMTQFVVDGQSVLLSDTVVKNDAMIYAGGVSPEVIVDIFYVRRSFNAQFKWGYQAKVSDQYGMSAKYMMRGTVEIDHVTDPSLFFDAFCAENPEAVRTGDFAVVGLGDPGRHVKALRSEINDLLGQAMANLRDVRGYACTEMAAHWPELRAEILRLANEAVAKYGVCLRALEGTIDEPVTEVNLTTRRLGGAIKWALPDTVLARRADDPAANVELLIDGTLRVEVEDEARLNSTMEGIAWRDPTKDDDIARRDIAAQVSGELRGRLEADISLLVFETKCDMATLNSFQGSLRQRMLAELNRPDGFFVRRGLKVCDMVLLIRLGKKSALYERYEKMAEHISEGKIETMEDDADTDKHIHDVRNKFRREDADNDIKVQQIHSADKIERAQHEIEQVRLQRQADLDAMRRAYSFNAWQDDQRRAEAEAEAAYARRRREQMEKQQGEISAAEHEAQIYAVAQRIEESKLSWREKLDAYARLQRGVAFRDSLEEREAAAGVAERENRIGIHLRAEENELLERLKHEEALHEEEINKQRFEREMERRRQMMAEEAARLDAQLNQARAEAAEREKRQAAEDEIRTLRLMLEYLAKAGEQQVTQETIRLAHERAEQNRQHEREEEARKAAEAHEQAKNQNDLTLVNRAMELVSQMAVMSAELHKGGKQNEAASLEPLMQKLNALVTEAQKLQPVATASPVDLNSWLAGVMAQAPGAAPGYGAAPSYGFGGVGANAGGVRCVACGRTFPAGSFLCPHCHRPV